MVGAPSPHRLPSGPMRCESACSWPPPHRHHWPASWALSRALSRLVVLGNPETRVALDLPPDVRVRHQVRAAPMSSWPSSPRHGARRSNRPIRQDRLPVRRVVDRLAEAGLEDGHRHDRRRDAPCGPAARPRRQQGLCHRLDLDRTPSGLAQGASGRRRTTPIGHLTTNARPRRPGVPTGPRMKFRYKTYGSLPVRPGWLQGPRC
jgi:hypothetical protein